MQKGANAYNNSPLSNELYINEKMNADELSNYILDKQSKFQASKPFFSDDNEVARKNAELIKELGFHLRNSNQGHLLQDDDGSYWVQDNKGNYAKVQGSTMGNLYRGLRDNGASMALGTVGAIGGTMLGGGVGMVAGGALGASLGAGYDYYGNTKDTNQDANLKEAFMLMGENAGLSLVGDAAFAGVAKGARALKNTYGMVKTGAQAGKDMIDGMAVKGGNLGNRFIDKIGEKDIPFVGKFTDGGLQNAETIFNNLTKNIENKKQIDELIAKENPIYLENGKPTIEILRNIVEQGLNKNNPQFIQDGAKRTSAILKNISSALQGVPTTQRREFLLKAAQAYPEIGSFLDDVLKADKDASISFLNMIKGQDEVFKNKTGLNGEFDYKAWQKDNHAYESRINQEYGDAISKLDKLNNGKIVLTSEDIAKLENFKNNNFLEQDVKNNIQSYLDEIKGKEVSAEQIFALRTAINKQLNTGNKTYNTKQAYGIVKEILDDALIRNASDKALAKEILDNANKNFALKQNFKESYLGMMKAQETKEGLADRLVKGLRNINEDKNLENAFKGMNEQERLANETHTMNALLEKYRIEGIGYDFVGLSKDLKDVEFSSKKLKDVKGVINTYALIYRNNRDLIMTALASSGRKTNSSMATTIQGVFDRILISGIFARLHALAPFMKSAKEQALRNQILDAIKLAKTNKEVISNLRNIKIADQEQSRIFKDALDNYIKVDKEQNKILKDALIKEGVIKGDNFFMNKSDPKNNTLNFIGKNGKEYSINKEARNKWLKTFKLKNIDDEYIPNIPKEVKRALKDREVKLTKGSLLKLIEKDRVKYIPHIKETLENPQVVLKDKDDFIFIKNIDNQTYFTSIGKDYETHLTIISNSPKKQNNIRNKIKNAEVVYYNNARALPTSGASSETKQVSFSDKHSTQAKPKESLMDNLDEDIKARKEFNPKIKDLIKGDNFFMDKANSKEAKSDLRVKMSVSPNVRNLAKLTNDEIIADLEYLANKHNEMFKKPSDVFKLIKEIKENPTFFYKNNRMDIALIAKRLNDNKLGKLGVNKDTGEVRHITKVKEKDLARLEKVSKKNTKENVGIIQTFIQPGSKNENSLNGLPKNPLVESPYSTQPVLSKDAEPTANGANALSKGNNPNSTQAKPKESLKETPLEKYKRIKDKHEIVLEHIKNNTLESDFKKELDQIYKHKPFKETAKRLEWAIFGYKDFFQDFFKTKLDVNSPNFKADFRKLQYRFKMGDYKGFEKYLTKYHTTKAIKDIKDAYNELEKSGIKHSYELPDFNESIKTKKLKKNITNDDALQRYDDYLGENKNFNLHYLDEMDLDPVHYNLTRQFIINAKKDTLKGIKHNIPERIRKQIEEKLNIKPIKEFGVNYAEYYHDGSRAIEKLILEKQGQVTGAFYRKDLGDIDLVWGEVTDKIKHKGYGLSHIVDKHPDLDLNIIPEIVEKGDIIQRENREKSFNIVFKDYILGVNKGFNKSVGNQWIVTAFEKK
ncbi:PBECR2 nuclease fold domain-containing protein [Campylobacter molothri]|uniref:putative barnase/colicin E5 family endoribonuclease n=1 Tax=Campylobacter molothri TaxID=1032242 RepID=UPI0038B3C85C